MANIFDYLDWRADVPLDIDPFNEVDGLTLAMLAYVDFEGIVPGPENLFMSESSHSNKGSSNKGRKVDQTVPEQERPAKSADAKCSVSQDCVSFVSIGDACDLFWSENTEEEVRNSGTLFAKTPFLLKRLCSGARFGKMKLTAYVNCISEKNNEQISALTCILDDGTVFVAYRGTDDTLIGWKEDFSFSFGDETGGQSSAVRYLTLLPEYIGWERPLRIGGHSKGGNFSIYSAAFCDSRVRDCIREVYAFDSPGFSAKIVETNEMQSLVPKIRSYVPEETIFGLLLEHGYPYTVIKSSEKGVWQHDALTWIVNRNRFEKVDVLSEFSLFMEKSLKTWIEGMTVKERKKFVDIIFSSFNRSGVSKLSDITLDQNRSIPGLILSYHDMDQNEKRFFQDTVGKLFSIGAKYLGEELQTMLDHEGTEAIDS